MFETILSIPFQLTHSPSNDPAEYYTTCDAEQTYVRERFLLALERHAMASPPSYTRTGATIRFHRKEYTQFYDVGGTVARIDSRDGTLTLSNPHAELPSMLVFGDNFAPLPAQVPPREFSTDMCGRHRLIMGGPSDIMSITAQLTDHCGQPMQCPGAVRFPDGTRLTSSNYFIAPTNCVIAIDDREWSWQFDSATPELIDAGGITLAKLTGPGLVFTPLDSPAD